MQIAEYAGTLGFDVCGIAPATLPAVHGRGLADFLARNHHGEMDWMARRAEQRVSPDSLWPEARSVVMLGHNYAPQTNPLEALAYPHIGNISVYARNADYHDIIKARLKELARWLVETHGGEARVYVDTAPLMEKPLAQMAGIGWQGKHTCLVSRGFGNWLFLGAVMTTIPLPPSTPESNHCGTCRACVDICPTGAISDDGTLDARKCISYLTIEHKGSIPEVYRRAMGNRIYGCDDCLAVCPWNKFAQTARESAYHARAALRAPSLASLVVLDDAGFRALFTRSPIKRIGRDRFIRNVLIAIGNTGDEVYLPLLAPLLHDVSALVAEAAVWADLQIRSHPGYSAPP